MATIKLANGWNRVDPPSQQIAQDGGEIECQILENFICGQKRIKSSPGSVAYNGTSLGSSNGMPWVERSYHIRGDSSIVKRTFGFYDGDVYYGDDVAGTFTKSNATGFRKTAIPLSASFQVSGNSILYIYTGEDTPMKYDGNGSFEWETTALDSDIEGAVSHLQRMWYWKKLSSNLSYSTPLTPETIDDEILVGDNAKDSVVVACIKLGNERFFVFKNNSIWELFGRTSTTFQFRRVTANYGLSSKRALMVVPGGIIFQNTDDKELYLFGGTEASIKTWTEDTVRLREIIDLTQDSLNNVTMTVHKNLFRFAFQHREDTDIDANGSELVYPLNDPRPDGNPKWSLIRGSNVKSYARWTKHGDDNELVCGRSDVGKMMYLERGRTWDGNIIRQKVRTSEIIASEDMVVRFGDYIIKGKPGSPTLPIEFRTYLNGRFPNASDAQGYVQKGETRTAGVIIINQSNLYNQRIDPLTKLSLGNSISFEFESNVLDAENEIYSISFSAKERYKLRNALVGNVSASDL